MRRPVQVFSRPTGLARLITIMKKIDAQRQGITNIITQGIEQTS